MGTDQLGRLERVDLRQAWVSEPAHFTPWLAQADNLRLLGDTIRIDLALEAEEKAVGPFSADILCKDTANGDWVVIENQLERTDHTHLGQLLTYAAGLNAVTIVWIAQRFTDEHRAALDWLNEHTDEKINAFGLEIELWRIGNSPIAPKFNIISEPNDWSRTVQRAAAEGAPASGLKLQQKEFWTAFLDHMEARKSPVRFGSPLAQGWLISPLGRTGIFLGSVVTTWGMDTKSSRPEIRAEFTFNSPNSKAEYSVFERRKDEIEKALGFPFVWYNPESKKQSKAYSRLDADFRDKAGWPQQFEWLRGRLEAMERVLRPMVRALPTEVVAKSEAEES